MRITPDQLVLFTVGGIAVNATVVFSWAVMALLLAVSLLAARRLSDRLSLGGWQNLLEVVVSGMQRQIGEISQEDPRRYLPFTGTLFLYIFTSNVLDIVPGFEPPTGSLSTTAALAACVFFAVPFFGIREQGLWGYLKHYVRPTPLMLPFTLLGEFTRTVALAVRLFGNIMSGMLVGAVLLVVMPLLFPVFTHVIGLLVGVIQAYIFAVLAQVYISSAAQAHKGYDERGKV